MAKSKTNKPANKPEAVEAKTAEQPKPEGMSAAEAKRDGKGEGKGKTKRRRAKLAPAGKPTAWIRTYVDLRRADGKDGPLWVDGKLADGVDPALWPHTPDGQPWEEIPMRAGGGMTAAARKARKEAKEAEEAKLKAMTEEERAEYLEAKKRERRAAKERKVLEERKAMLAALKEAGMLSQDVDLDEAARALAIK